ncbi:hypothetical protein [Hymenobacter sp. DG25A]|jgi:hypothetical protein|uniref:hypothetical protein n=1 Tax=Hymenobacter sp. DG25A TaxID=1385663 RepID=UPI0006BDC3D6|nr:hypothetical protein [Hymenobacter sp. DG25A]ALD20638.1 hypothetical protein AM218_04615 [Hymenobacter sp. DG25A]
MTDTYLRSLGFTPTDQGRNNSRPDFNRAWRYQHDYLAQDGTSLFIEHPLGIDSCRLSNLTAPLNPQDVFATVPLNDLPALEGAIQQFYAAHGGQGSLIPPFEPSTFRPYRRAR